MVLDVNRSLKRFPPGIPYEQRVALQDQLTVLILRVIMKYPHLKYYQVSKYNFLHVNKSPPVIENICFYAHTTYRYLFSFIFIVMATFTQCPISPVSSD